MKARIEALYLDWFNNFLSIASFAKYYELDEKRARRIIDIGQRLNHRLSTKGA